jgi:aminoglycoside phosphotransferase (APT) family kinase protein
MNQTSEIRGLPFPLDSVRLIGEGFNSRVFAATGGWILKAARYDDALPRLIHEKASLERMPRLSVDVPRNYEIIEPCSALPFGGAYYRCIEGLPCTTLTSSQQQQLGRVMLEIHGASPSAAAPAMSIDSWDWNLFAGCLTNAELETLRRLFQSYPGEHAVVRLLHGDVWPENLIEQGGRLAGLLDWEQSGAGDVAIDFAGLAYLPEDVLEGVLRAYIEAGGSVGRSFSHRLRLARLSRELSGLHHAILHPASGELSDALGKVRGVLAEEERRGSQSGDNRFHV